MTGNSKPMGLTGDRLAPRALIAILLYGGCLFLLNPGRPWALTFHEVNFAEPAREFLRTGDWVVPRIVGRPAWDKPPLMHWSIALALGALGTEAEWAARLPTTLATLATALLIARLAARRHGRAVGLVAGLVQLSTVYVLIQGRLAEADMLLCGAVTAAWSALAAATIDPSPQSTVRRAVGLAFFGATGLAFLAKGPLGLALVGLGAALYAVAERRREVWRVVLDPLGWAILGGLVAGWPLLAILSDRGLIENWWSNNVRRLTGELGGEKGPFFYLYTIPWLLLPWTPFVASGLRRSLRPLPAGGAASFERLLGAWFLGGFALIAFSAWKHKHYAIPILPPLSIYAAVGLQRLLLDPGPDTLRRVRVTAVVLTGVGLGVAAVAGGVGATTWAAVGLLGIVGGVGLGATARLERLRRPHVGMAGAFGTLAAVFVLAQALVMPRFDLYRPQADLGDRLNRVAPPGATIAVVEIPDPQITYYLRPPLARFDAIDDFAERLAGGPAPAPSTCYVVGPARLGAGLQRLGQVRLLDRAAVPHPKKSEADRLVVFEVTTGIAGGPPTEVATTDVRAGTTR